jgi:hypothetical protein
VFAASITRSWIDQPALARQGELAGQNRHRPGTLPAAELQALFARRAHLTDTLAQLRSDLEIVPRDLRRARDEHRSAVAALGESRGRLQRAFDTLAEYDRPFRRRGHEHAIADANRTIEDLPGPIGERVTQIRVIEGRIDDLGKRLARARELDQGRPALQTELADIDSRLDDDRRIRTRQIRRTTPERITATLGVRPAGGETAKAWDIVAGRLDQHQSAYGITKGLGRTKGAKPPAGYDHSRTLADTDTRNFEQAITLERQRTRRRESPALRIGR